MPGGERYERDIAEGLDRAFDDGGTEELGLELDEARLVVFSDHHKGVRDGADDFRRCERAYNAALAHYLRSGHTLFVLGDAEELWECSPEEVLPAYERTLELEREFLAADRYERFWGNHDDRWRYPRQVAKHLRPLLGGLKAREALKLSVTSEGRRVGLLFLVHGHQGTLESERLSWLSRLAVRHLWRPLQRRLNVATATPATDWQLRDRHDAAMFRWARQHPARPTLIAGHTHRPVFGRSRPEPKLERSVEELERQLDRLKTSGQAAVEELARAHAELEFARAERRRVGPPPIAVDPPCYFNTGCCSFGDGDITGIEIADGKIRLVRWPDDEHRPVPKVLVQDSLGDVLEAVRTGRARQG